MRDVLGASLAFRKHLGGEQFGMSNSHGKCQTVFTSTDKTYLCESIFIPSISCLHILTTDGAFLSSQPALQIKADKKLHVLGALFSCFNFSCIMALRAILALRETQTHTFPVACIFCSLINIVNDFLQILYAKE